MEIIYESMSEFLNENLGVLSKYNLSKPVIDVAVVYNGTGRVGPTSEIKIYEKLNYKIVAAALKPQFGVGFIVANGVTHYMLIRESDRKYNVFNLSDRITEARGYNDDVPYNYKKAGWMASLSAKGVFELIKGLIDAGQNVTLEMVEPDAERQKIVRDRQNASYANRETLSRPETNAYGSSTPSPSQQIRNRKISMKRKVELEKKVGAIAKSVKEDILMKFDEAMDKVLGDVRNGYSWNIGSDEIGKKITKGLDISPLKKLAEMYKLISQLSDSESNKDIQDYLNKLNQMGL